MAWIDTNSGPFTNAQYEFLRDQFEKGIISREEFLGYLPAHIHPEWIDCGGYLIPVPVDIPEPVLSRFDILDL